MSAPTGGRPNVIGSSMAIVASEPMPGSTPISVPTSAPIMHNIMLVGVAATPKPKPEIGKKIIHGGPRRSAEPGPKLERQVQAIGEQERAEVVSIAAHTTVSRQRTSSAAAAQITMSREARDHETERTYGRCKGEDRADNEDDTPDFVRGDLRSLGNQPGNHHGKREGPPERRRTAAARCRARTRSHAFRADRSKRRTPPAPAGSTPSRRRSPAGS